MSPNGKKGGFVTDWRAAFIPEWKSTFLDCNGLPATRVEEMLNPQFDPELTTVLMIRTLSFNSSNCAPLSLSLWAVTREHRIQTSGLVYLWALLLPTWPKTKTQLWELLNTRWEYGWSMTRQLPNYIVRGSKLNRNHGWFTSWHIQLCIKLPGQIIVY